MALPEGTIGLTPDSSGKKVRNLVQNVPQSDGTSQVVYVQVSTLVDEDGNPVNFREMAQSLAAIASSLRRIEMVLSMANDFDTTSIDEIEEG